MRRPATLAVAILGLCAAASSASTTSFHVCAKGSDKDPGTKGKPFRTLERAREALREARKAGLPRGGVTVWLRGGVYARSGSFLLSGEQDSGTKDAPIAWRGMPGETVRLIGGKTIPASAFKPVTDEPIAERIDAKARGKILAADLKALGITGYGTLSRAAFNGGPMLELFFKGKAMPLARWPNGRQFATYGKVLDKGSVPRWAEKPDRPGKLLLGGDRFKRWAKAPAIWLHGYWHFDWYDDVLKVATLNPASGEALFTTPHLYGLVGGRRYAALNLLEEIDTPGEWTLDRGNGILYVWPPEPVETATIAVSLLRDPLIVLEKTSHVTLRDVVLEMTQGKAAEVRGGTDNLIAGCVIRNTGTNAVSIGPAEVK